MSVIDRDEQLVDGTTVRVVWDGEHLDVRDRHCEDRTRTWACAALARRIGDDDELATVFEAVCSVADLTYGAMLRNWEFAHQRLRNRHLERARQALIGWARCRGELLERALTQGEGLPRPDTIDAALDHPRCDATVRAALAAHPLLAEVVRDAAQRRPQDTELQLAVALATPGWARRETAVLAALVEDIALEPAVRETVLGLAESWAGSRDDLVSAARTLVRC